MKSLIAGRGEIGRALGRVLTQYDPWYVDRDGELITDFTMVLETSGLTQSKPKEFDILHICFPYNENFESEVERYQELYQPKYTVVHSTVKPGTCRKLGAISSPCLGIHPNLEPGIRTFIKFLAGEQAGEVANYFRRCGLKVYLFDQPETAELMKILDTTFYGLCVEYTKNVKELCKEYDVPFEAWTLWTDNYNTGYQKLGYPEFTRPNLVPILKPIGGHCVLPNLEMVDTPFTKLIKELNDRTT